jgi:hypothetical protein
MKILLSALILLHAFAASAQTPTATATPAATPAPDCISASAKFRTMLQITDCKYEKYCVYDVTCGKGKDPNKEGAWTVDDLETAGRFLSPVLTKSSDDKTCPTDIPSYRTNFGRLSVDFTRKNSFPTEATVPYDGANPPDDTKHYNWGKVVGIYSPAGSTCTKTVCLGFANTYDDSVKEMFEPSLDKDDREQIKNSSFLGSMLISCSSADGACPKDANQCAKDKSIRQYNIVANELNYNHQQTPDKAIQAR